MALVALSRLPCRVSSRLPSPHSRRGSPKPQPACTRTVSFEYFPPKSAEGIEKLKQTIALMVKQSPLFLDFTWGAGGSTSELTIELCADA